MRLRLTALAILIGLLGATFAISAGQYVVQNKSIDAASAILSGVLSTAAQRAPGSANGGVTVVISQGTKTLQITTYDGRPDPSATVNPVAIEGPQNLPAGVKISAAGVASGPPIAIFIASDASSSVAAWNIGYGSISEPTCSGTQTLTFSYGATSRSDTFSCSTATILATPQP